MTPEEQQQLDEIDKNWPHYAAMLAGMLADRFALDPEGTLPILRDLTAALEKVVRGEEIS